MALRPDETFWYFSRLLLPLCLAGRCHLMPGKEVQMPAPSAPNDDDWPALIRRSQLLLKEDVPPWATQRALDVWQAPAPAGPGLLQRVAAVLRFDSWQGALALRSQAAAPRQLLFSVGQHDIDLRVRPAAGDASRFEISGQILGPAVQGQAAWQPGHGENVVTVEVDPYGEFVLTGLPAGWGQVQLTLDETVVELPRLDLGGATDKD